MSVAYRPGDSCRKEFGRVEFRPRVFSHGPAIHAGIPLGVAFVNVLEEGGAFLFVERLVVGAGQAGVEGIFDGELELRVGGVVVHSPALPNRTGGSPASGFPVNGLSLDWLRHSTRGARRHRTSRAVVAHPPTPFRAVHWQVPSRSFSPVLRCIRTLSLAALSEPS